MKRFMLALIFLMALIPPATVVAACNGYTVKPGDTLYRIALAHGTTYKALARLNGIVNPDRIYVGQCLKITTRPESPVPTQASPTLVPTDESTTYTRPSATVASGLEGYSGLLNTIVDTAFSKCPDLVGELSEVRLDEANATRPSVVGWYQSGGIAHLLYISADRVDYIAGVIAHEAAHARQERTGNYGENIEIDAMIIASTCG